MAASRAIPAVYYSITSCSLLVDYRTVDKHGIAEFAGLEFAGLENDGRSRRGV